VMSAVRTDSPAAPRQSGRIRAIAAGSAGNLIEWYDFYTYAFMALYFAPAFFPTGDRTAQLLDAAGIYAIGFLVRPLGAWWFGRYGDRQGRKGALIYSVLLMGVGSLLVCVLPTYRSIGESAPILLLIARLIQGFSTGGQYGPAAAYLSETPGDKRRGFFASFQYVTLIGGQLCALLVLIALQHYFSADVIPVLETQRANYDRLVATSNIDFLGPLVLIVGIIVIIFGLLMVFLAWRGDRPPEPAPRSEPAGARGMDAAPAT